MDVEEQEANVLYIKLWYTLRIFSAVECVFNPSICRLSSSYKTADTCLGDERQTGCPMSFVTSFSIAFNCWTILGFIFIR